MTQTEAAKTLTFKGFEFKVAQYSDDQFAAFIPSFDGGRELAGTRDKTIERTLIRTVSILDNAFLQPAVTSPRVGDLLDIGTEDYNIIVKIEGQKLKSIPLKDAKVYRNVQVAENKAHPYIFVQNKIEDLSNETMTDFPSYIILEDGVLHTNNFPKDVFVWKGKLEE